MNDRVSRIEREIADGTYETPDKLVAVADRVHAKLRRLFGWRDGENHDDQPLVCTGYTHELDDAGHIDFSSPSSLLPAVAEGRRRGLDRR